MVDSSVQNDEKTKTHKQIRWLCYCKCARALKVRYFYYDIFHVSVITVHIAMSLIVWVHLNHLKSALDIAACKQNDALVNMLKPLFVLKHVTFLAATAQL